MNLTDSTGKVTKQYTYDAFGYVYNNTQGNYTTLLQKEIKTAQDENNNSNVKQTVYTYDANGNQVTKTADGKTETNTYDGLNQLIGFTDGETTASYKYNASGLRYEKIVDGQRINHVWDGSKQIIADVIDNQFYEADCYIRGTNLVAKYNYRNGNKSEYTYYTQNAHGDVVNLTNADGEVTKKYTYDAFGVEKNIDENDTNAFRYCGEYFDAETGTIYLRARYYNPTTGRFISRDSFAGRRSDPLSLNLYTYCKNNPIRFIDPSGHSFKDLAKSILSAVEAAGKKIETVVNSKKVESTVSQVGKAVVAATSVAMSIASGASKGGNGCGRPTRISEKGAELLISLEVGDIEGDEIMTKDLGDGGITIGFGTFIEHGDNELRRYYEEKYNITIKEGEYLSRDIAMKIYKDNLSDYEDVVSRFAENNGVALTQNQFDALTMQAYNRPSDAYFLPYLNNKISDEALVNQIMGVYQENTTDEYYSKYAEGWRNRVSKQVDLYRYGKYE